MKKLFLTFVVFCIAINVQSQDFDSQINTFKSNLNAVKSNKKEYNQTVEIVQPGVILLTIEEVDNKGKTITKSFIFNTSDINKGSVKKVVKKDVVYLQMKTKNKQKLIKQTINNEKTSYVDNLKIYAEDITNARALISSFTASIPLAKKITNDRLSISTYNEYLNWLTNNIEEVDLPKLKTTQQLKENTNYLGNVTLDKTITTAKDTKKTSLIFNLLSLNPKSIKYKINGESLNVFIETNNAEKVINYTEDTESKFVNKFLIACKDVEQARDLKQVLKKIIPLANKQFMSTITHVNNINDGLSQINKLIGSFDTNAKVVKQSFKGDCIVNFDLSIDADKTENHQYNFSFSDIDANKVNYASKGEFIIINLFTKGGEPFIKHIGADEKSSYIKTFKLYTPSLEKAIILKSTLKDVFKLCGGNEESIKKEVDSTSNNTNISNDDEDDESESQESSVSSDCKPNKSAKQTTGDFVDLYGGRIRSGGFMSNDESVYSLYIGQIDGGKKGTTVICVLNEPIKNKDDYNNAVNNFLNENNLKNSVLELTLGGKTIKIPATECKQKPTRALGSITGYLVTFEGDILKDQIKLMQDYDLQRFRLIIGGHPYERFFRKPTKRTKDLKRFFNCVNMNHIFELKKKDATKMDLSEVVVSQYSSAINGKWVLQGSNGAVTEFNNGKLTLKRMGVKKGEGTYKVVGNRVIITTNAGNSISEISMFLKDMLILKEKGVEKTYERID